MVSVGLRRKLVLYRISQFRQRATNQSLILNAIFLQPIRFGLLARHFQELQ